MLKNPQVLGVVFLVIAFAGIVQFGRHVRAVDAAGLIVSGALGGVGICILLRQRKAHAINRSV
jgi:hypothetical protein